MFVVNFEHKLDIVIVLLLLTLNMYMVISKKSLTFVLKDERYARFSRHGCKKQMCEKNSRLSHKEKLKDLKQFLRNQQLSQAVDINVKQGAIPNYPYFSFNSYNCK